jgi:hypothetical protein
MPSPFPGMDPYIERPEIWPDFHQHLVVCISRALLPLLRPRYVTLTQHRRFVDEPPWREDRRQSYVQVIQPAAEDRAITVIEVLSPDNKRAGPARTSYLQQREEFWSRGANLVEIDLLRAGEPTVRVPADRLTALPPWDYLAVVSRQRPAQQEMYCTSLTRRLPRIMLPLAEKEPGVVLDLQADFTRCWEEGPYPELLQYDAPPPGTLTLDEVRWCEDVLRKAGLRPPVQGSTD